MRPDGRGEFDDEDEVTRAGRRVDLLECAVIAVVAAACALRVGRAIARGAFDTGGTVALMVGLAALWHAVQVARVWLAARRRSRRPRVPPRIYR